MKQIRIFIIIMICFIISSCGVLKSNNIKSDSEDDKTLETKQNKSEIVNVRSDGELRKKISFEEAISDSYLIIEATLESVEPIISDFPESKKAQTGMAYYYKDIALIKGQYLDNDIKVTINNDVIDNYKEKNLELDNVGEKYYLVLCRKYSVYWNEDKYIPYEYLLLKNSKGKIEAYSTNGEKAKEEFNEDTFKNSVNEIIEKNKVKQTNIANWGVEYTNSKDISEISEFSDLIVEVQPKEVIVNGGNTLFVKCELINSFKGEFDKTKTIIFLAEGFEISQKYLLLLSDQTGSYFLSSKNSCIPISDKEKYEEYMQYIGK